MDLSSIVNTSSNHEHSLWSTHAHTTSTPADEAVKLCGLFDPPTEWTPASASYRNRCPSHPSLPPNSPPLLLASDVEECRSQNSKVFQFHLERSKAIPSRNNITPTTSLKVKASKTISKAQKQYTDASMPYTKQKAYYNRKQHNVTHFPPSPPSSSASSPEPSSSTANDVEMMNVKMAIPAARIKQRPVRSIDSSSSENAFALCFGAAQVRMFAQQQMARKHARIDTIHVPNKAGSDNLMTSDTSNVGKVDQHMTKVTTSSQQDRHMKKAKTEAAVAYDNINIHVPDSQVFDPEWVPSFEVFNDKPVRVVWKGTPLAIEKYEFYDQLHPGEVTIASTLRLLPEQYIRCKRVLILAAQEAHKEGTPFRKSEAQKLCRIDVNKVSTLWSTFGKLGWLGASSR